jgi:SMODS-associated and fused to various effectors sensor domain
MLNKKSSTNSVQETNQPTRHIPEIESRLLWVRSGGRCARCNKYLLEDKYFETPVNIGQRAHIAGWTDSLGSPRGNSELPIPERNKADNLILLCHDCHVLIDEEETKSRFPESHLLEMKREHEERILHLTGMAKDRDTAVLRVFGSIRGSIPEMARETALRTVIDNAGRYAKFPLATDKTSIEIDLTRMPDAEATDSASYWNMGKAQIDSDMRRVSDGIQRNHIRHLSIFALARIPFLVYLGYVLDDKIPAELYQKHKGADEGWLWPESKIGANFEIITHHTNSSQGEIALILSLSGTVPVDDLPEGIKDLTIWEIRPVGITPNPNLFRSQQTLDAFARSYQDLLANLEQTHKSAKTIHLFPAAPITAAITCGRHLMRGVHPALTVYDKIDGKFQVALTINEKL